MTIVRQILKTKGNEIYTVPLDATVLDALKLMESKNIGAVLVMEGDKVKGLFSERDYARKSILKSVSVDTPIGELMTRKVYFVGPEQTLDECMALMTDKRIRHLPVVSEGKLIGVISIGDVVKAIITNQEISLRHLEDYIMGTDYYR